MQFTSFLDAKLLCPFQIFVDIFYQLQGIDKVKELIFKPLTQLDTPSDWVNLDDSVGNLPAMRAYEFLTRLRATNITYKIELSIIFGNEALTQDNLYALLLLSKNFSLSVSTDKPSSLEKFLDVKNAYEVASCEKLVENRKNLLGAKKYIQYGWDCLKSGAAFLGCRHLEAELNLPHPKAFKEEIFYQLQVIRFLSHQHQTVSDITFLSFETITKQRVEYLYFIKAFSCAMVRDLKQAEICFARAKISASMIINVPDHIYQLNLYALFQVLKGNTELAFAIETRLLAEIKSNYQHETAMNHVIKINIARLYKKDKNYTQAFIAYEEAYKVLEGGACTLFDLINFEMDKLFLYEAQGEYYKALDCCLKAVIFWLACENPYAIPLRLRLIIDKITDTNKVLSLEQIDTFFITKIKSLFKHTNNFIDIENDLFYTFTTNVAKPLNKFSSASLVLFGSVLPPTNSKSLLRKIISNYLKYKLKICDKTQSFIIPRNLVLQKFLSNFKVDKTFIKLPQALADLSFDNTRCHLQFTRSFLNKTLTNKKTIATLKYLAKNKRMQILIYLENNSLACLYELLNNNVVMLEEIMETEVS